MRFLLNLFTLILMLTSASGCQITVLEPDDGKEVVGPDTPPVDTYEEIELTLVTYNVANMGHGGDRLDDIARFIQETGADYAGLNEVDSCNQRHSNNQMKDLAEKLGGWNRHFASAFEFAGGGYGNGTLCRKPLLDAYTLPIPQGSGHEPRSVAVIETEDIVFCATHLDFGPPGEPSYEQAVYLNQWFAEHYDCYSKPVIICGDFNTDPGTDTIDEMDRCWTRLSSPILSWPSDNPTMCLDYFFCYKGAPSVEVLDNVLPAGIVDYSQTSDHMPVVVKIQYRRKKQGTGLPDTEQAPVVSAAVFGPAADNSFSSDPVLAAPAKDASGNVIKNVFDVFLGPDGGSLRIKDDQGRLWCLQEGGLLAPGDGSDIPPADGVAILLRLDFGSGKWDYVPVKSVELQPYKSEAKPIPMVWEGKGIFKGEFFFGPGNGYSRYHYRIISDREDIAYGWVRGQGGTAVPVLEDSYTGAVIFGVEPSLSGKQLIPYLDVYSGTQWLKIDNRDYNAVLIGDSITQRWGDGESSFFSANGYLHKGISGQTSTNIRNRFKTAVIDVNPYVVHIMCGTNDVAENGGRYVESSEVLENIDAMVQMALNAHIKPVVGSVFPCTYFYWRGAGWSPSKEGVTIASHIQEINTLLKAYCLENNIPYIDYYSEFVNPADFSFPLANDGCHPGSEAIKRMSQIAKPVIDGLL